VHFVMCHNGALLTHPQDSETSSKSWSLVISRVMSHGFDVALINEIEWTDCKVHIYPTPSSVNLVDA
jgi:hypothetical protein